MQAAIQTEELSKDYLVGFWRPKPHRALDALSFSVAPGEIFGFLGPNGAGKSTTIKLLVGLIFPTHGRARLFDCPAGDPASRRRVGFLPENPSFYDYLTGEELVAYFAGLSGWAGSERTRRVASVLDELGVGGERRRRLRTYSRGMLQRVGVAQAIVAEPDLVILDEPMSGLDPIGRRDFRQLILGLRDRGCTVFFSSHILADAEALCSRVGILAEGRLVAEGRPSDLVAFERRGWELVVAEVTDEVRAQLESHVVSLEPLSDRRYLLELGPDDPPERILLRLSALGVQIVSLTPIRPTLEEYFVATVRGVPGPGAHGPA